RDYEEAFERYLGDYAQANIRKPAPAPEQAISWIHAAGGKAVWAHPLARSIQRTGGFDTLVRDLEAYGLDGIEEVHPSQNAHARRRIRRMARKLSLRLTGGSDFHGEASPGVRLGVGRGNDVIPSSVATELLA